MFTMAKSSAIQRKAKAFLVLKTKRFSIESKWQKAWKKSKVFKAKDSGKDKYYILEMFPYPSGSGLHIGHARNYAIGDSLARFKRLQGFNVMYPMGWDSFGLPAENAAIAKGIHPVKSISQNIKTMKDQMAKLGSSYDWDREITTHNPEYYKWDQWLFLQLYKKGLAYRKKALGNWCPNCNTTIANEDVKNGRCWRCDSQIVQKELEQWFIRTTNYADELLKGLEKIDWSNRLKSLQTNWIGKSDGVEIDFKLEDGEKIKVFTTRPDTLPGCTFIVLAPEHPQTKELVIGTKYEKIVQDYIRETEKLSELDRKSKEKTGIFLGKYAINPLNNEKIPVYAANFVLLGYGTGAIMSVPAHDKRDEEFAKLHKLPIKPIQLKENDIETITNELVKKGLAKKVTNYALRDWNISRQRYWGSPIPIIYCVKCGIVPVPEKDLPVKLPLNVNFKKKVVSPLATNKKFLNTKCPKCRCPAKRETDTMTTFIDSSWYYLRYCDPKNKKLIFDKKKATYWMPVDQYIGGIEHAVGHLLYSRFITKFLKKNNYINIDEPFSKLLNQGLVTLNGVKMSKSKGNVVDPMQITKKYGADVLRTYLLSVAQPDTDMEWSDKGLSGVIKFIDKVKTFDKLKENKKSKAYIESVAQRKIELVTLHLNNLHHNRAVIELFDFSNKLERYPSKYAIGIFLHLLYPFAPHICEEVWSKLGNNMLALGKWPEINKKLINEKAEKEIEAIDKVISDVRHIQKIVDTKKSSNFSSFENQQIFNKQSSKVILYVIPFELENYKAVLKEIEKELSMEVKVFALNDKAKYDPENKAGKAKPGRPAIYLE